jgi:hypothetical protein
MTLIELTTPKAKSGSSWPAWAAILVGIGIIGGVVASLGTTASTRGESRPADRPTQTLLDESEPSPDAFQAYRTTLASVEAAVERHDWLSAARFRSELENRMTPETIRAIHAERAQLLANLDAASARHDGRMRAAFSLQLAALCPAVTIPSGPGFCE